MQVDDAVSTAIGISVAGLIGAFAEWVRSRARARKKRRAERVERARVQRPPPPICEPSDPPPSNPPER